MDENTTIEIIRQWLDEHWDDVLAYYGARMRQASQVETVSYDEDKVAGVLSTYIYDGVSKVVNIPPASLLEGIGHLDEEIRRRCIAAAEEAERQAAYAEREGDRVDTALDDLDDLKTAVTAQGNAAEQKGNAAQTAADNADASRVAIEANEATRQSNESTRQTNETARQSQEATRQSNETSRTAVAGSDHSRAESDHSRAESDHTTATADHTTAGTDHTTATSDHTQATSDHTASVTATNEASNVDATLAGMTVTITDRHGVARSQNIGFEIDPNNVYASKAAMVADAANVLAGKFCMIATTDPTAADNATLWSRNSQPASAGEQAFTFLSDLDQASAAAWADWLENEKPQIEAATALANEKAALADSKATLADQKAQYAQAQGDRAKGYSDHPWEIRNDGYIWVWDETTQAMVRTNKMIIDFSDLTDEQREQMIRDFYDTLVFASEQTCEDIVTELT